MKFDVVFYLFGRLLCLIGALMVLPAVTSAYYNESQVVPCFLIPALVALITGVGLNIFFRKSREKGIGVRDGFLLVTLAWVGISLLGAFPYFLSGTLPSLTDAIFESTSGFTTTGASVMNDIEAASHGILLWRDFTQWIGGMGIVVLAVAILPQLSVGGMQLMKNELPGPTFEQLKPRIKQTALSLWKVYILFSLALGIVLYLLGMPIFETICHVFGTVSTGGFSPKNASIQAYGPAIQFVLVFFMFLAGTNFVLHHAWLHGNFKRIFRNPEFRLFVLILTISSFAIVLDLSFRSRISFLESIRLSVFQVVSIATSTGFVTADFDSWPYLSKGILFLLMLVGGCAGSTGGGMKQIRLLLLLKEAKQSILRHIYPKAVVTVKLEKRVVSEDVLQGVSSSVLIFLFFFAICSLALLAYNFDFVTATSTVVACISNIGPGFGLVGATHNFAFYPATIKILLSLCMIVGRLELFTVLVLFVPATWKR